MSSDINGLRKLFDSVIDDVEAGFLRPAIVLQGLQDIKTRKSVVPRHFEHFLKALYYGTKWEGAVDERVQRMSIAEVLSYLYESGLDEHEIKILRLFFGIDDPLGRPAKPGEVGKVCRMSAQLVSHIIDTALTKIRRRYGIKKRPGVSTP